MEKFYLLLALLALMLSGCYRDASDEVQTNDATETEGTTDEWQTYQDKSDEVQTNDVTETITETITETEGTTDEWQTYQDEQLGIAFDYPMSWELLGEGDYRDNGSFWLNFNASGLSLMIFGVDSGYVIPQAPASDIEKCAANSNVDEFCENGCEKVKNDVALKYKTTRNGDWGFNGFAYTSLSQKYPAICFELGLSQVLYEIAEEKGINYYEVPRYYDVESMIKNREVSESVLQVVDEFESLIETIKPN